MKHILCFGDSNTWGYSPKDGGRYDLARRWPGVLQRELGEDFRIIEEDPTVDYSRSGMAWLPVCLATHRPLDLVILMLGTNDLKVRFGLTPWDIASGAARLVKYVGACKEYGPDGVHPPRVLLVSPIHLGADFASPHHQEGFGGSDGRRRSLLLAGEYEKRAMELDCRFFDAASAAEPSPVDGIHLDDRGHHALALALAAQVREVLL